jgi:hypothetical protein
VSEQFTTLFDSHYLPQGLALYRSLERQGDPFHLWILAMDEACAAALERLALSHASVLRLAEVEDARLLAVKGGRSVGEYCWTLTPFLPAFVFARAPGAARVTYLDADLYFFDRWAPLLAELDRSGKAVQITEHAFAPEYAARAVYGRFCVQFMTFRNDAAGRKVLGWWQDRCLEWCHARLEDGKFGDQLYLEDWPQRFGAEVHVLEQRERTLAPWNVAHFARAPGGARPAFYHFHSLKLVAPRRVQLWVAYRIGRASRWIYRQYVEALRQALKELAAIGVAPAWRPAARERLGAIRHFGRWLAGRMAWADL